MKRGFARPTPEKPPVIKPENIVLSTPLSIPPPEGKPWWLIVVGVVVVGLLGGMVAMVFASGSHVFGGIGSIFPLFMMVGIMMMMFRGMGGGQQQMSRPKLDAMRAQFMLMLDMLRETAQESADSMDANYRWFHPAPNTLAAAVGSPRMWERKPDGKDLNFGVVRVGVGMTRPEVTWGEPQNMPTDIELEPVTGKALQEFGRYQSVVYNLPKMVSLLVEPWYALVGEREQVLGLMRAIICQLAFSHGPDHVQMIVVSSDLDQWDWVKWLPHFGDSRRHDAAGNARMVYTSVREFAAEQAELFAGRGSFTPRHASSSAQTPTPHTVIIADVDDPQWEYVISAEGVDGVTFFDLTGSSMWTDIPERKLQFDKTGVIEALPRDRDTWMVIDDKAWFFALTDQVSIAEAEEFAQKLAQWRLAEAYEEIGQRVAHIGARDILSYYGIDDPGNIDFDSLWASRTDTMGRSRLRAPFGNRSDNGELLFLDMKSLDEGGDGPHGVMSGTTGSGKSTLVRTVIESLMLSHPPEELQFVLADLKGGSAVKPFAGSATRVADHHRPRRRPGAHGALSGCAVGRDRPPQSNMRQRRCRRRQRVQLGASQDACARSGHGAAADARGGHRRVLRMVPHHADGGRRPRLDRPAGPRLLDSPDDGVSDHREPSRKAHGEHGLPLGAESAYRGSGAGGRGAQRGESARTGRSGLLPQEPRGHHPIPGGIPVAGLLPTRRQHRRRGSACLSTQHRLHSPAIVYQLVHTAGS